MKFYIAFALIAAVAAKPMEQEWKAEYGKIGTQVVMPLTLSTPLVYSGVPEIMKSKTLLYPDIPEIMNGETLVYPEVPIITKGETLVYPDRHFKKLDHPYGFRTVYDPEFYYNIHGFYPTTY